LKVTNDDEFAEYAANNFNLDEDPPDAAKQDDSSGYFSDEELQDDEKEEVADDDFFNLLNQNILENDTARKPPTEEEHLNLEETNDFADTMRLVNDATMFDAEQATNHMDDLQRRTAHPLPYAAGHWQGGEAQDGDADGDHYQTFEVDEDHNTSLTPEKKQFKSDEVDSPGVIPLTQFLTKPPPHKKNVDDKDDEKAFEDVWDENWIRDATLDERQKFTLYPGGGLYSIAEE